MAAQLIVNADDFGLTNGVNRAIGELSEAGAVTSATLMATGAAFEQAVHLARGLPQLGVGCHIVLTDGLPVCNAESIPSLIGDDGRSFRRDLSKFWLAAALGRIQARDIEREAAAQVAKVQNAGITVTHIDTHKHTHIIPAVARALLNVAERFGILYIRNPFEGSWSLQLSHGSWKRHLQVSILRFLRNKFESLPQIRSGVVRTTNGTIGISATGSLDSTTLDALLRSVPEGVWELVCHPGYNDCDLHAISTRLRSAREVEREALLSAFQEGSSQPFAVELIHYGKLASNGTTN